MTSERLKAWNELQVALKDLAVARHELDDARKDSAAASEELSAARFAGGYRQSLLVDDVANRLVAPTLPSMNRA